MATDLEKLQGQMINTLLAATGFPAFKGETYFIDGQYQENFVSLLKNRRKLSHGEQLMFAVAWEIWTWEAKVKIFEICDSLPMPQIQLVFSLYLAWKGGEKSIRQWIIDHGGKA